MVGFDLESLEEALFMSGCVVQNISLLLLGVAEGLVMIRFYSFWVFGWFVWLGFFLGGG